MTYVIKCADANTLYERFIDEFRTQNELDSERMLREESAREKELMSDEDAIIAEMNALREMAFDPDGGGLNFRPSERRRYQELEFRLRELKLAYIQVLKEDRTLQKNSIGTTLADDMEIIRRKMMGGMR